MDAEGPALADQAVEQQRGLLGELVVLDEELLELVDDQQDAGQGRRAGRVAVAVEVLHAGVAEPVGPRACSSASSRWSTLRPNSRSLSIATTLACGSSCVGVDLELDPLLEVDQVELDLVGAVVAGRGW